MADGEVNSVARCQSWLPLSSCSRRESRIQPLDGCLTDLRLAQKIGHRRWSLRICGVDIEALRHEAIDDVASAGKFDRRALRRFWLSKGTELLERDRNRSS